MVSVMQLQPWFSVQINGKKKEGLWGKNHQCWAFPGSPGLRPQAPSVLWQPGWEGSVGENGYTYMYG